MKYCNKLSEYSDDSKILISENYTNYSPQGVGEHKSRHGYNGDFAFQSNNYLLGNGNRMYLSSVGAFNQKDLLNISNGGAINSYSYTSQDPINKQDPSGNSSTGFFAGNILGIVAGIAGIVMAIPTGGASLTVSGAVAISFAGIELTATTASVALYSTDHKEGSSIAGWVAMGFGLAGLGAGSISAFDKVLRKTSSNVNLIKAEFNIDLSEGVTALNHFDLPEEMNIWNHFDFLDDTNTSEFSAGSDNSLNSSINASSYQGVNSVATTSKIVEEDFNSIATSLKGMDRYNAIGNEPKISKIAPGGSGIKSSSKANHNKKKVSFKNKITDSINDTQADNNAEISEFGQTVYKKVTYFNQEGINTVIEGVTRF